MFVYFCSTNSWSMRVENNLNKCFSKCRYDVRDLTLLLRNLFYVIDVRWSNYIFIIAIQWLLLMFWVALYFCGLNLVTKSATTQKGLQTCSPFEYLLPKHFVLSCMLLLVFSRLKCHISVITEIYTTQEDYIMSFYLQDF